MEILPFIWLLSTAGLLLSSTYLNKELINQPKITLEILTTNLLTILCNTHYTSYINVLLGYKQSWSWFQQDGKTAEELADAEGHSVTLSELWEQV